MIWWYAFCDNWNEMIKMFKKLGIFWMVGLALLGNVLDQGRNTIIPDICVVLGYIIFFYCIFKLFKRRRDPKWGIIRILSKKNATKSEAKILDPDIPEELHEEKTENI